jgi:hypothetical protein
MTEVIWIFCSELKTANSNHDVKAANASQETQLYPTESNQPETAKVRNARR